MLELPSDSSRESVAEGLRRETVAAIRALNAEADPDLRRLVGVAVKLFGTQAGSIALVEGDKLWFHTRHGLTASDGVAANSFAAAIVGAADLSSLVVLDALADERFALGELVVGEPRVRFHAGALITVRGQKVGSLCVMGPDPRSELDPSLVDELIELAGLCGSLFELKDEARVRARMAADLIREEWRHALTLEAGRVGSWVWDLRNGEIVANDILRQMFGLTAANPLHVDDLRANIEPADMAAVDRALYAAFEDGVDYNAEFRVTSTGRWLIGRGRVYQRDGTGKPLIMMGVMIDVTEARESAEQMRLLLRELNHRVKNTLAMIQSLARQTLRDKPDPQQFIDTFSGRLRTLSEAHTLLADRDWSGIGLIELLHSQINPYLSSVEEQLVIEGNDVKLPPDQALGLGLIVHELTSNAGKFGALSRTGGKVRIAWTISKGEPPRIDLTWKETGGPRVLRPARTGFGTRLIERSLDKVLGSSVVLGFPEDGAEAKISLPL